MRPLVSAELSRLLSRRLVRVLGALVAGGIGVGVAVVFARSGSSDPPFRVADVPDALVGAAGLLLLLAWVIGASSVGAEWHAGTIATQLTWEPARARLFAAKGVALAVVIFLGALALQALLGAGLTATAALRGVIEDAGTGWLGSALGAALRSAALAVVGAMVGFSIAWVARNTSAALGGGFVYAAVLEPLLRSWRPGWARWLFFENVSVFLAAQDASLRPLDPGPRQAGGVLLLYAAAALGIAVAAFRHRDVT